jgi:hypothetical protein
MRNHRGWLQETRHAWAIQGNPRQLNRFETGEIIRVNYIATLDPITAKQGKKSN